MRKNIFLILLVAALFVFVGAMSNSAKAADDPVDLIKNAKTPVHLHSMAPGDELVHDLPSLIGTQWHSIYPPQTYCHDWVVIEEVYTPPLNYSDMLKIQHVETGNWVWIHVEEVTITLVLALDLDTMYVEFEDGIIDLTAPVCNILHEIRPEYSNHYHLSDWTDNGDGFLSFCDFIDLTEVWHVTSVDSNETTLVLTIEDRDGAEYKLLTFSGGLHPDSVNRALTQPISTWWHEEEPEYCNWWHIDSWIDNGSGELDHCDYIDFGVVTTWHVEDVAIDILVQSIPDPTVPTLTQWGVIILAVLIVASAIYIMVRRRRAAVPA